MTRFEYKGREIEIFTIKNGDVWNWAFTVDGVRAAANRDPECCKTPEIATDRAREMACGLIDLEL